MDPSQETLWRKELERLKEALETAERRRAAEMNELRAAILALESGIPMDATPEEEPELPQAVIQPPPLPVPREPIVAREAPPLPESPPAEVVTPGMRELHFGKVWFVRIGVVIFLTGLAFLGNYAYQNWVRDLPNSARLAALFACALAMAETGRRLARRETLAKFGEVLLAGGMAFFYYCTFAAHQVERLRVIDSPVVAGAFLTVAALAIAAVSWLRQARATAALGFLLASYATMLQPIGWLSCFSNLLMAGTGLFFMLRRGWAGPGVVSMLGTCAAFFGWQVLGAAQGRAAGDAVLWYLPSAWAMFALPGVVDRFRESLGERGRAWFTGVNNALFFLLFSHLWLERHGGDGYWQVAGVFGLVLLALGIAGRRTNATAGGVNVCHGLLLMSLALILKLDGYHLALGLALESLALAGAFTKFKGRSEAVFSVMAGLASGVMIVLGGIDPGLFSQSGGLPLWSVALAAVLLAAAAVVMRKGADECRADFHHFARTSVGVLVFTSAVTLSAGCFARLVEPWPIMANMAMAAGLAVVSLRLDAHRRISEVLWAGFWFALNAFYWLPETESSWGLAIAAVISIAACRMWHHQPPAETKGEIQKDLARQPSLFAWTHAVFVAPALWLVAMNLELQVHERLLLVTTMSLVVAILAVVLRCGSLAPVAGIIALAAAAIPMAFMWPDGMVWPLFVAAPVPLIAMVAMFHPWPLGRIANGLRLTAAVILRVVCFIFWCQAWWHAMPASWFDWLAATAIVMTVVSMKLNRKLPLEALCFIGLAFFNLGGLMATSAWTENEAMDSWRGFMVVASMLLLVFTYRERRALIEDPEMRAGVIRFLAFFSWGLTSLWATQMMVWRFGWKPAAVLWTVLGFLAVSAGLWQRLRPFRLWGFALLVLALAKVFISDVWDFNAFMRVISFTVLGAALILLGLFYNHFAPVLRRMLDEEDST